jgi:hypothetical protein
MTREEWKTAHRLARIARHRRAEAPAPDALPAAALEQDLRRLARHAAILSRAGRGSGTAQAAPVPRTRHVALVGLFMVLLVILAVLARQEVPMSGSAGVMQADAPASAQVQDPAALPATHPA